MTFLGLEPLPYQVVNDSGATRSADAIFEVKPFTFCPTRLTTTTITLTQQTNRDSQYKRRKVRNLDVTCASAVVGDGNNNGKTIIPLCFGALGEVNDDLDKVTQCLAREAASTEN